MVLLSGRIFRRIGERDRSLTMPSAQKLDTHHKALTVNLDTSTFGSFAEIGAGQEVARWFLLVGAASGTVAKTISAYDKEVSDAPGVQTPDLLIRQSR